MANLTGQNIKDTYQQLVTLGSGTTITNGTGSQITDLAVTASWASNAVTASYALNAGVTVDTGSLMVTGSVSGNVLTFTKGNGSAFNLTVDTGSATTVNTGSLMVTASAAGNVITFTKGDASTFAVTVNTGSGAVTASYALNAEKLGGQLPSHYATAGSVTSLSSSLSTRLTTDESEIASLTAATSSYALKTEVSGAFASTSASFSTRLTTDESNITANTAAITSLTAATSSYALKTEVSGAFASVSSSFATRLTTDEAIITSLVAATGSYAKTNTNNSFTGLQTFNNIAVNGTASIGYLEAVTGSAKIIGDAYIILNNDTPAQRYAGIKVIDSGSANVTASLLFDGQTNDWFYEYESGDPTDFGVFLVGPEYGTIGSPIYPTTNQIQKGTGTHHLTGSNITDDDSKISISIPLEVTGNINSTAAIIAGTGGFSGSLNGNADTATSASHALYANQAGTATSATTATSASYATSAGSALTATSASFATYANTAGTATSATTATSASFATFATTAATASYFGGSVTSASFASTASYVSGEAVTTSGDLQFTNILGEVYGSVASPVIGNLTISGTSTKRVGAVAVVFHTGSSEPTVSGGTIAKKVGTYSTTALNVITFTNVDGTNYLEYIAGAPITSVTSASYALTASYAQNAAEIFPYTGAARITGSLNITGSVGDSNVVSNYTDTFTSSDPISQIVSCTQAEYNSVSGSANASRTLYVITDASGGGQYVSGSLTSNVNALSITSNTASMDCQAGNFFTLTLGASATTFVNPTNIQAGQTINLRITQPTPNTGSISFGASVKQVSGSAYSPTALASAVDIVTFVAFDTSSLYLANLKKFV